MRSLQILFNWPPPYGWSWTIERVPGMMLGQIQVWPVTTTIRFLMFKIVIVWNNKSIKMTDEYLSPYNDQ